MSCRCEEKICQAVACASSISHQSTSPFTTLDTPRRYSPEHNYVSTRWAAKMSVCLQSEIYAASFTMEEF